MALPPRQDGRAHDWHQVRHRRFARRLLSEIDDGKKPVPGSLGDPFATLDLRTLALSERTFALSHRRTVAPSDRTFSLVLTEVLGQIIGQDVDLTLIDRRAVFHHRHDDVPPLFAVVVAAKLCDLAEVMTARARRDEDLLAFPFRQIVLRR